MAATADMLVRLYALPDVAAAVSRAAAEGVSVRRPEPWERDLVVDWVRSRFSPGWAAECGLAFSVRPPSCFIAVRDATLVGFACHDCTRRNFFGPAGVDADARGRGIGAALTLAALAAMRDAGYAYAIIGGVGPAAFYTKVAGARRIAGSTPGIYDFGLVERGASPRTTPRR
jgi:GNAT superfamily N-acetyltransferase